MTQTNRLLIHFMLCSLYFLAMCLARAVWPARWRASTTSHHIGGSFFLSVHCSNIVVRHAFTPSCPLSCWIFCRSARGMRRNRPSHTHARTVFSSSLSWGRLATPGERRRIYSERKVWGGGEGCVNRPANRLGFLYHCYGWQIVWSHRLNYSVCKDTVYSGVIR